MTKSITESSTLNESEANGGNLEIIARELAEVKRELAQLRAYFVSIQDSHMPW